MADMSDNIQAGFFAMRDQQLAKQINKMITDLKAKQEPMTSSSAGYINAGRILALADVLDLLERQLYGD